MESQITGRICVNLFKRLGLVPDSDEYLHPSNLIGLKLSRDDLLKDEQMDDIADLIQELRGYYSASGMSCLRGNRTQKSPVLNTLRQVCKANGLLMKPYSKSNGYELNGKKKLYRWFEIHALDETLEEIRCQVEERERLEDQNQQEEELQKNVHFLKDLEN